MIAIVRPRASRRPVRIALSCPKFRRRSTPTYLGMGAAKCLDDGPGLVGRTIVDQNHLVRPTRGAQGPGESPRREPPGTRRCGRRAQRSRAPVRPESDPVLLMQDPRRQPPPCLSERRLPCSIGADQSSAMSARGIRMASRHAALALQKCRDELGNSCLLSLGDLGIAREPQEPPAQVLGDRQIALA